MTTARWLLAAMLLLPAAGCELLEPPVKNLVDCRTAWTCGDQETAAEDDGEEDLCLDPAASDTADRIEKQKGDIEESTCDAIPVTCTGGVLADCAVTCVQTTTVCEADAGP